MFTTAKKLGQGQQWLGTPSRKLPMQLPDEHTLSLSRCSPPEQSKGKNLDEP